MIKINQKAKAYYEKAVKEGKAKVFVGKAKYELVHNYNDEPIEMDLVDLVDASINGKPYQFGSMCRVSVDHPVIGGDFPCAHGEKAKFEQGQAAGAYVGIYLLKEDILNDDGSIKVKAGAVSRRVNFVV